MLFDKPLASITELDIQTLIDAQVAEQKTLEYKRKLPDGSNGEKKEFLADVSSFANTAGGYILYGIEEQAYLAGWIIPTKPVAMPTPVSSAPASVALPSLWLNPSSPEMIGTDPEKDSLRGGILNEQTGALLSLPALTEQGFAARRVTVPNRGTFTMKQCQQGQC